MRTVNMLEAKSNLSRYVEAVETGAQAEIIIARNGRPAARLVPLVTARPGRRVGVAKGRFIAPRDIDAHDEAIAAMFNGPSA